MRKITNRLGLPQSMVEVLRKDDYDYDYDKKTLSTTDLIGSHHITLLGKEHGNDIEEDVADKIYSFLGNCVHALFEKTGSGRSEERIDCLVKGFKLTGKFDYIMNGELWDYKVTSVYKIKDGVPKEWEEQLNIYSFLCKKNKIKVNTLHVGCILRDWSIGESFRSNGYPKEAVVHFKIRRWTYEECDKFIVGKIKEYEAMLHGRKERKCTAKEMWASPEKFAVKKTGNKRATKVFDNIELAQKLIDSLSLSAGYFIEIRPAIYTRCDRYCNFNKWCKVYQERHEND